MKLYADSSVRRSRQVLGDVLLAVWVAVWVRLAFVVHAATVGLAAPGRQVADAGNSLAGELRQAGTAVGGVPLVGDEVKAPFRGAAAAADQLAGAGTAEAEAVSHLALWLGLAVGVVPVLVVLAVYLPLRWRFVRTAETTRALAERGADVDLFALRALANQPLRRLAAISEDPAAAWRRGEEPVVRALAALELRSSGLELQARGTGGGADMRRG
jgi:hypothetical protein